MEKLLFLSPNKISVSSSKEALRAASLSVFRTERHMEEGGGKSNSKP